MPTLDKLRAVQMTGLDRVVAVVIVVLLALIGATILLGDHVGVQVVQVAPVDKAHSTSPITIHFKELMDHDSVAAHFKTDPALDGTFSWDGAAMTFRPSAALKPSTDYSVVLEPGAASTSGREVLNEVRYSFTVTPPRVAYLAPADGMIQNVWMVDPANPDHAEQVTDSSDGVFNFSVSPDGTRIAYTENHRGLGTADIMLLNLETGTKTPITHCANAFCASPVWRPDGQMIAYERAEIDPVLGTTAARIWLIDLTTSPISARQLFEDSQILGYGAQWSADGSRIAVMDSNASLIRVYDFNSDQTFSVSNRLGTSGALSPDGKHLLYPEMITQNDEPRTVLRSADLDTEDSALVSDPDGTTSDQAGAWSPDGTQIAIARQDDAVARGTQIVLLDLRTDAVASLTDDPRYSNSSFWWDPTGTQLVIYRFPLLGEDLKPDPLARPEIWTLDVASRALTKVASNAFLPSWVP